MIKFIKKCGCDDNSQCKYCGIFSAENVDTYSLKDLIEKCGYGFRSLSLHSQETSDPRSVRWIAKSGASVLPKSKLFSGHTPEEAVLKLLKALAP